MIKKLSSSYDCFFLDKILKSFSIKNKKICIAVSGGVDSMVLLNLFLHLPIKKLGVAHCNFNLRKKESNKDELFIKKFCFEKKIECHIKRFDTFNYSKKYKLSIQMSARKLRYDWFKELLKNYSYEYLALGHHLNDSIETFFLNLIRGTGIKGLLGITKKNGKFIRPLYSFTKKEILNYANFNKIKWRIDKSNQENKYLRNKIRLVISNISSYIHNGFKKSIKLLHKENYLIEKNIINIYKKITIEKKYYPFFFWKIEYKKIKNLEPLSLYLFKLFFPYGFNNIKNLKNFFNAQSGKQLISKNYRIINNRNHWIVIKKNQLFKNKKKIYIIPNIKFNTISLPINIKFFFNIKKENIENSINMSLIDFNKIQFPLQLRTWKKGDFFFPLNMKGKKKLSKYYKEKKFSLLEKEQTWLLINGNGYIIFVIGYRLDNRFKVTKNTKKILGIKI
ncbi:tRNA lysidine(34) synthetase TilS [Blattabacterium cuenoti]|uniref:tRNA lysidine(34) synthetase TilS n=1 Tax=Blattabacterium cuenoti TaxID=1653831 RepID=UPI00163BBE67|nr:tRNA lysidine(34) synthetase TilS [Blattabacterium cuenoti]